MFPPQVAQVQSRSLVFAAFAVALAAPGPGSPSRVTWHLKHSIFDPQTRKWHFGQFQSGRCSPLPPGCCCPPPLLLLAEAAPFPAAPAAQAGAPCPRGA